MSKKTLTCEQAQIRIMGLLDEELSAAEAQELNEHLEICPVCRAQYDEFSGLRKGTAEMKFKKLPEMYWDEYWTHVYNRMERGISWVLVSIGFIILFAYGSYDVLQDFYMNPAKPVLMKIGVGLFSLGIIVLFVSVLREKIMVRKLDKYRSIER